MDASPVMLGLAGPVRLVDTAQFGTSCWGGAGAPERVASAHLVVTAARLAGHLGITL